MNALARPSERLSRHIPVIAIRELARNEIGGTPDYSIACRDSVSQRAGLDLFRRLNHVGMRTSRAVTASEALRLDPPFIDALHECRYHRIRRYRRARNV